jgi:hypothetical protein
LCEAFPFNAQLPENRKEVYSFPPRLNFFSKAVLILFQLLVATAKLLLLAAAGKVSGSEDWEKHVVQALHLNYRRSVVVVKEKPLHLLLSWLKTGELEKYKLSEQSFRAAAFIACVDRENPTLLFSNLLKYKSALLDKDCARFARLEVLIPDFEKQLATAQASKKDLTEIQEQLITLKAERDKLEQERVAFPNPLIMFCKLQGIVDSLQSTADKMQLDEFESEMDAFRAIIQG